ncbi:magnesium transporter CorA family protein [Umezawaea endophytica]|uniref:Magnesium transporter CorA family protein n=1 Tax=Umezawaea endophytica TaxID=1654476 RepID=A0A9X2VRM4_9PSEU|nr:magnesium transporter CorA family protein [Umezawaea endophytica]MCS7481077.1 magnesium transporter CorA family protein [Umezawaea endophytica]
MARTRLYRQGTLAASDFPLDEVSKHLEDPDSVVWVDFRSPTEADLTTVAEELGLHALAVEDALTEHERPKFEQFDGNSFLKAKAVRFEGDRLVPSEVSAFITERALITVRDDFDFADVLERWDAPGGVESVGAGYLLHGLLDSIVDGHLAAAQALDDEVEALEDALFEERPDHKAVQGRALRLRKNLVVLRRVELPMADVVGGLLRADQPIVTDELRPYFQDVHDHVLRVTDWTESLREMTTTLRETQLTAQGNVMNMIMKKVTSWAAIIAVPTAITGFYGQNLPYPGFEKPSGFWVSTVAILALSGFLYLSFKKRDWL